ncbi:hypothetical protein [Ktedonobacter robiniae]|nr:hypothetical protein [Ktedonobacter robiniae]
MHKRSSRQFALAFHKAGFFGQRVRLQKTSQKAPVIYPGDEWLFLVWG